MVYWHIETDFVAIAIFVALLIKAQLLNKQKNFTDKVFVLALTLGIGATAVDIFSSTVMNDLTGWWPYEIGMILYALFAPLLTLLWVLYTVSLVYHSDGQKAKRMIGIFLSPYLAYSVICITNPLHEWMFSLSADMVYARGPLFFPLGVGSQLFYAALGTFFVVGNWKKMEQRSTACLLLCLYITTTACYFIQMAFPGWLIICSAYAIAFLLCDAVFESQRREALYQEVKCSLEETERTYAALKQQIAGEKEKETAYQEKLEDALLEAKKASQAKSDFLSRMSHDIRTPINGIRGMLEIIEKNRDDQERVDDCLRKIQTASSHLLSLINDVLDMSKLESGEILMVHEPFNLRQLLEDCGAVNVPMADESGIRISCDMEKEIPHPYLVGSPLHLRQIIINIVSNAIKYNKPGGMIYCEHEEVACTDTIASYRFTVTDTGIGIEKEYLEHVFEPFSQERESSRSKYGGTGLGLAIVKKLLDKMGGTITVESKVGVGSRFTFTIPFERDLNPPAAEETDKAQSAPVNLSGAKILLVEDNELNQEISMFLLEEAGAEVELAGNGQVALEKFAASPVGAFKAILMDVMMPVMDGLAATRAIRALDREDAGTVPIIAMTANAFHEDIRKCMDAGMDAHLAKPLDSGTMLRTIGDLMD